MGRVENITTFQTNMTNLANSIRTKSNTTGSKTIVQLKEAVDSIESYPIYLGQTSRAGFNHPALDYLCFTANTAGSTITCPREYEYSSDRETWNTASTSSAITLTNAGDKIYLRKGNADTSYGCGQFAMTGSIAASGNVMSLVDNTVKELSMENADFEDLFNGCSALTSAPKLPAITLRHWCYYNMFKDCTNLTTAPDLPALEVPAYAYGEMFHGCTNLVNIPDLPALTIGDNAYGMMFCDTGVTAACAISASKVGENSLLGMFSGCKNLTTIANLYIINYPENACNYMYGEGDNNLISTTQTGEYQYEWRVPFEGTGAAVSTSLKDMFIDYTNMTNPTIEVNTTYYVKNPPVSSTTPVRDYLCFTAKEANSTVLCPQAFDYSSNGLTWQTASTSTPITLSKVGDKIYLKKGSFVLEPEEWQPVGTFTLTGRIAASGNVMSLLDDFCEMNYIPTAGTFGEMFLYQTALVSAPKLPALMLSLYCYCQMFRGTSITIPPELPATILANYCYSSMFQECPLEALPTLVATNYPKESCAYMCGNWPSTYAVYTEYSTKHPYKWRIPMTGSIGTIGTDAFKGMIEANTGGNAPTDPLAETTYYLANAPIIAETPAIVSLDYLCFTANTAGSTVKCPQAFEYSADGFAWSTANTNTAITLTSADDKIYIRNGTVGLTPLEELNGFGTFVLTGSIAASGNIMSLLDNSVTLTSLATVPRWCFYKLFYEQTALTSAPRLPATTLNQGCYKHMFEKCTNLLYPPELNATIVPAEAYGSMFAECTSLLKPTKILAETIEEEAMYCMFIECNAITELPRITATGEYKDYGLEYAFQKTSVKVYDTYSDSHPYEWRVPMTGTATEGNKSTKNIIAYTGGDHGSTDAFSLNTTYYLENPPI